jgi:hypothetical protein
MSPSIATTANDAANIKNIYSKLQKLVQYHVYNYWDVSSHLNHP